MNKTSYRYTVTAISPSDELLSLRPKDRTAAWHTSRYNIFYNEISLKENKQY